MRHEDARMFKQHIDVYRKAWTDAGHPGEAPVYLRCPGFVAKTDAAAQEAYGPTLMRHFQNQSRLLADSSRWQNSPPDHPRWKPSQRLTEITLEETLRGSAFIGSPDTVVGKLKDLQRDIGLSGVQLEPIARAWQITGRNDRRSGYRRGRSSRRSVERPSASRCRSA